MFLSLVQTKWPCKLQWRPRYHHLVQAHVSNVVNNLCSGLRAEIERVQGSLFAKFWRHAVPHAQRVVAYPTLSRICAVVVVAVTGLDYPSEYLSPFSLWVRQDPAEFDMLFHILS
jgi:hypothetical protein